MADRKDTSSHALEDDLFAALVNDNVSQDEAGRSDADGGKLKKSRRMKFDHFFSKPGIHPFDDIKWEIREAVILNEKKEVVFKQSNVEVPAFWSQLATNVVVSKYFHGAVGTDERETSVKKLINRVSRTIADWGKKDGYFASAKHAETYYQELTYLLVNQYAAFNSPVWFNVGIEKKPQCSACFINSVEDRMESILDLAKIEGMLFKFGSGTGTNLSTLRSSKEAIAGGGIASGPVSFMKGFDAFAGVIKSGGKTRRAAKMVILNADHPDIMEFINSKSNEEKKAWSLIDAGYDGSLNGEAYGSIFFQNANHSVRVTDDFMKAAEEDLEWETREVKSGKVAGKLRARDILQKIAEGTHICGDPGMQFDTTINEWHTCRNSARINASNPCSEYMFIDNTACNLASLNLMKFLDENDEFDVDKFRQAVRILITAMEIIVDNSSYPREEISRNSHLFRTLGLGYANLGALIMSRGRPYDSDEGRSFAAVITSIMTGQAYLTSSELAEVVGPFEEFNKNRDAMLTVIQKHRSAAYNLEKKLIPEKFYEASKQIWDEAYASGKSHGYRNAQVTVLAPTGTIAFLMDCDTTGIEPDIALVKYKKLVGGGLLKIVNQTVVKALEKLNYSESEIKNIIDYIQNHDTIEGAPALREEDLPVFDCAFKPINGQRSIHYMGHVNMLAATQPFISGAISKTVNVPENITVDEIRDIYIEAWKSGLKAISIYRDNSKRTQPLSTSAINKTIKQHGRPYRRRLPDERHAITHKFSIGGHEGYITAGMYEDGSPGEIFIVMAKEGSAVSGLMDAFATAISMALQYGVPLKVLCNKFTHSRFEPSGFTNNPRIPFAKSIMDYLFRWLALKFLSREEQLRYMSEEFVEDNDRSIQEIQEGTTPGLTSLQANRSSDFSSEATSKLEQQEMVVFQTQADAPNCPECGSIMVRNGNCYKCIECGTTSGCS
ncbi:MAG: vitamin B12-dependent ribonucleotide reductase [Calditrichaeota bacterium]|nr:vitamin B12-dependent ribonucleotide reductase [Calditrichota bacterium]RQV93585.1 MAG: vitamin B12-dependent ribonucleotide reductase [bacterium]RQW06689.1 MAG: vitamin B12-dependent ribonucleotide reductase [Calditrichota bacterium]